MSAAYTAKSLELQQVPAHEVVCDSCSINSCSDDDSDEYFEDDLIPDDCSDVSSAENYLDDDINLPDSFRKKLNSYPSVRPHPQTAVPSVTSAFTGEQDSNTSQPGSNLNFNQHYYSTTHLPKKRLSVDPSDAALLRKPGATFFTSIGNFFRANKQVTSRASDPASSDYVKEPSSDVKFVDSTTAHEAGTSFSSSHRKTNNGTPRKKVIHFSPPPQSPDLSNSIDSADDDLESSSTESFSAKPRPARNGCLKQTSKKHLADAECEVLYDFYSSDNQQCTCFRSQFKRTPGVSIIHKPVDKTIAADALVVPGNSFGFLDGEPEIRYVEIFGWVIQKRLRQIICHQHDGELLVGEAIVLPLTESESSNGSAGEREEANGRQSSMTSLPEPAVSDRDDEKSHRPTVRNLIYVPVMRVPNLVQDTVNAYLAFRAAVRAVNAHNQNCDEAERIRTVACPALCADIGRMPPGRIALQMKTAYDTFALGQRPDLRKPDDLGHLATNHVEMATAKNGNWC